MTMPLNICSMQTTSPLIQLTCSPTDVIILPLSVVDAAGVVVCPSVTLVGVIPCVVDSAVVGANRKYIYIFRNTIA